MPECDGLAERVARAKVREVTRHGRVQINLALLNQLHDGDVCKQLRDGADAIDRFGCRRHLALRVGESEALRPDYPLVVNEGDGERGYTYVNQGLKANR